MVLNKKAAVVEVKSPTATGKLKVFQKQTSSIKSADRKLSEADVFTAPMQKQEETTQ